MTTLFISDLHLGGEQAANSRLLLRFLQEEAQQAEALYILGDLFEVWLGDDLIPGDAKPVIHALRELSDAGTQLYIMHGNRDFLLGETFSRLCGAALLEDPCMVNLYGSPTLLMHGDLLCTDDIPYQEMRKMLRDPNWINQFLAKPPEDRIAFARELRERSKRETGEKTESIMDVNADTVLAYVEQHSAQRLIHGHTHRAAEHLNEACPRYVLGDWHKQGSALQCDQQGCRLLTL